MKKTLVLLPAAIILLSGCGQKNNKEESKSFISVPSLIEKQVALVDTSLYMITKIVTTDSLHSDTSYIKREDFRTAAKEFLEIPDLSDKKIAKRFKEETPRYDQLLGRAIISYTPVDPVAEEYKSQELTVAPNEATGDNVKNIIVTRVISNRDSFMQKNMLWMMDKSFTITTLSQKPGQPEKTTTTKVTWNEDN
jgi:hypothetical protein